MHPCAETLDHLRAGTQSENRADCVAKGRHVVPVPPRLYGEQNPAARLSDAQRDEIRLALGHGASQREAARRFGVSQRTVCRIGRRLAALDALDALN